MKRTSLYKVSSTLSKDILVPLLNGHAQKLDEKQAVVEWDKHYESKSALHGFHVIALVLHTKCDRSRCVKTKKRGCPYFHTIVNTCTVMHKVGVFGVWLFKPVTDTGLLGLSL